MSKSIRIVNVNDDRRIPLWANKYDLQNRFPKMVSDYPIQGFNEISRRNLDHCREYLAGRGFKTVCASYSPNQTPDMSFYHLLAWNPESVEMISWKPYWFTSTPSEPLTSETRPCSILAEYNESFERGTLIAVFRSNGQTIIVSMNHFGLMRFGANGPLEKQYTNYCAGALAGILLKYSEDYPGAIIIAGADFNVFAESKHMEIFAVKSGFIDNTPSGSTFLNYFFDLGLARPEHKELMAAAQNDLKELSGQDYVDRAVRAIKDIHGGPLRSRTDRIYCSHVVDVKFVYDFDTVSLDDYGLEPLFPSDHNISNIIVSSTSK
jgi:hypothetical protein